eukprot:TRINITY_DN683_c0_g1_i5.p1 TRINITY_DN683_c0_g1~~TRINITY_DN683_c0_g1_i5.p1  ORF type:complete len:381 (-),score=121.91 TRINITY_DN683_c0_g1_i5:156-1208(-)
MCIRDRVSTQSTWAETTSTSEKSPEPVNSTRLFEGELFKKLKVVGEVNMLDQLKAPQAAMGTQQRPTQSIAYGQSIINYLKSNNAPPAPQLLPAGFKPSLEAPAQNPQQQQVNVNAIYNLLMSQNKQLNEMKERNDKLQDTLTVLVTEVNSLRTMFYKTTLNGGTTSFGQTAASTNEVASQDNLMALLYPRPQQFSYQLVVKGEFPSLLYRERNFRFDVSLVDLRTNETVGNLNKIPLSIAIYSSEVPPKLITVNTSGNKVVKGTVESDLVGGTASFDKVQINEVTSHFRNGWVFVVIYPKMTANLSSISLLNPYCGGLFIDPLRIKPLIFDKIVVKAKKAKEMIPSQAN